MKKIILGLGLLISIFFIQLFTVNAIITDCHYDKSYRVAINLMGCLNVLSGETDNSNNKLVQTVGGNGILFVWKGFKNRVLKWVKNISIFLSIMAVGSIAYGALLLTISTGDDEKIKKAKDTVKWGMIGFLGIISAGGLIAIVINLAYTIAPK